ncbi:hypothetical protein HPP92_017353 [Vanilla planifolia]|uniref:RNA polymerase II C-terminal domain phosphatase-like n=1 Tax=Vanilla planifolia TaxID=51239 RepID=A0A835UPJ9_VANPL|nr:hypothetical protein HPP92_017353 [Vanilla planifolia]
MFAARKLCLVLDLDHTLLNSAKFGEVDQLHEEILRIKEEQDRGKPQRHLFRFQHMGMWTKLRPGVWNFLEKASKIFELHLYTMGNKLYATEMAKVLDPSGTLFAGRVISKGDDGDLLDGDERVPKSKDLDGVLGMESAVVIIDDSVRVWPHNKHNLIVVERYTYFPCSRRQFGLLGPSLLEIDHDERPEDGTLASCLAVIERLHQIFFSHRALNDVDVRHILASEQRKILAGCRVVFSRVFPVGEANPHLHPLWQTAEQFGAVCTNQIDEQVTHVVANSLGTDKVNWALCTGRFVVHPGWVEASALLYRRANETDFTPSSCPIPILLPTIFLVRALASLSGEAGRFCTVTNAAFPRLTQPFTELTDRLDTVTCGSTPSPRPCRSHPYRPAPQTVRAASFVDLSDFAYAVSASL